jgi:hypothetical protein
MTRANLTKRIYLPLFLCAFAILGGCQKHGGNLQLTRANPVDFGDTLIFTTKVESVSWRNAGTQATDIDGIDIRNDPPFAGRGNFQATTLAINATSQAVDRPTVQEAQLRGNGVNHVNVGNLTLFGGHVVAGQILDFGNVRVGTTGNPRTFLLQNSSPNALTVTVAWSRGNQGFAVAGPGPQFIIPAFVAMPVTLTFTPAQAAQFTDSVKFSTASGAHMGGIAVTGRGVQGE